jgi:hypothetical protein
MMVVQDVAIFVGDGLVGLRYCLLIALGLRYSAVLLYYCSPYSPYSCFSAEGVVVGGAIMG